MNISKACLMPLFLGSFTVGIALGQQGSQSTVKEPEIPSQVQTLSGQLVYHDGIRKWFELKLDRAQFGQVSIQLVPAGEDWKPIEVLRGCRVRSKRSNLPFADRPLLVRLLFAGHYPKCAAHRVR
jgi:hypothetical protein